MIQNLVEDPLAEALLTGQLPGGPDRGRRQGRGHRPVDRASRGEDPGRGKRLEPVARLAHPLRVPGTCGATSLRWEGQCRSCGNWNTLVESLVESPRAAKCEERRTVAAPRVRRRSASSMRRMANASPSASERSIACSAAASCRDPWCCSAASRASASRRSCSPFVAPSRVATGGSGRVLYASGEESAAQLRMRAGRLGLAVRRRRADRRASRDHPSSGIVAAAEATTPALLIIDSIQTLTTEALDGPAGSVGQVREAAARLQAYAKENGVPAVLVGHVTKDGTLGRAQDARAHCRRRADARRRALLRTATAAREQEPLRFDGRGRRVRDGGRRPARGCRPGRAFIESESLGAPGVAVAATLEGSRPLLVEVQALVAPQVHGSPRRTASGLDSQRLALLIAVLGRRAGMNLASHDVYASVVGGLVVEEPAIDLPLALSLASALRDRPLISGTVLCGEIGLTGELRPVHGLARRSARGGTPRLHEGNRAAVTGQARAARGRHWHRIVQVATLRDAISCRIERATAACRARDCADRHRRRNLLNIFVRLLGGGLVAAIAIAVTSLAGVPKLDPASIGGAVLLVGWIGAWFVIGFADPAIRDRRPRRSS